MTSKQAAASIVYYDMDLITGYWSEKWDKEENLSDNQLRDIQHAMNKIVEPFLERLNKLCNGDMLDVK